MLTPGTIWYLNALEHLHSVIGSKAKACEGDMIGRYLPSHQDLYASRTLTRAGKSPEHAHAWPMMNCIAVSGLYDAADHATGERSRQVVGLLHQNPGNDVSPTDFLSRT